MLYTKKGDNGLTTLFSCSKKFSKGSARIEALGALDELNSLLGFCKTKATEIESPFGDSISKHLESVQNDLFVIQAEVAGAKKKLNKKRINEVEKLINKIAKELVPFSGIKSFTISGGTELSALLDYSRAVARKAERRCVAIKKHLSPQSLKYLNRLSSLLFALARLANKGIKEKKPKY